MATVVNFTNLSLEQIEEVGGKNASLGEMITKLVPLGIKVPKGFATTVSAYQEFLRVNKLEEKIQKRLSILDVEDLSALRKTSRQIRRWILRSELSKDFQREVLEAYENLHLNPNQSVAVRSSATAEDLPTASFAG